MEYEPSSALLSPSVHQAHQLAGPGGGVLFPPGGEDAGGLDAGGFSLVLAAGGLVFPGSVVLPGFATAPCTLESAIFSPDAKLVVVVSLARTLDVTLLASLGLERDLVLVILTISNAGLFDIPFWSFLVPLTYQILLLSTF